MKIAHARYRDKGSLTMYEIRLTSIEDLKAL